MPWQPWMWVVIGLFVVADAMVLAMVFRKMRPLFAAMRIRDLDRRRELLAATETMVSDRLRDRRAGDADSLRSTMAALVPELRGLWSQYGAELDESGVATMIEIMARKRGFATAAELRAALCDLR